MEWQWEDFEDHVVLKFFNVLQSECFKVKVHEANLFCTRNSGTSCICLPHNVLVHTETTWILDCLIVKLVKFEPKPWSSIENAPPHTLAVILDSSDLKTDFTETGDTLVVYLYVKNINECMHLDYSGNVFVVHFATSNSNFLKKFKNTDCKTRFVWRVFTRGVLNPAACFHKLNKSVLEIILQKLTLEKWGGFQSLCTFDMVECNVIPSNKWLPTSQQSIVQERDACQIACSNGIDDNDERHSYDRSKGGSINLTQDKGAKISAANASEKTTIRYGLRGLNNLGNTCFMNSVIQCLSYTQELRQYFCDNSFKDDLNINNPLGMKGQLAVAFAVLLRQLWTGDLGSVSPLKLKSLVSEKSSQFQGFAQHDAQEFMALFLDGLHEDLNRVQNKPYILYDDSDELSDSVIAESSWNNHKLRNDSVIVDLFQGQYKSTLVCPVCNKISVTFDPFLYLSVPLPPKPIVVKCTLFPLDPEFNPIRIQLSLPHNSNVAAMLYTISNKFDIPVNYLSLWDISRSQFNKTFPYNTLISSILQYNLCVYEIRPHIFCEEEILQFKVVQTISMPNKPRYCSSCNVLGDGNTLKFCIGCRSVVYCGKECQQKDWKNHKLSCEKKINYIGQPFIICLPRRQVSKQEVYKLMKKYSSLSVSYSWLSQNIDLSGMGDGAKNNGLLAGENKLDEFPPFTFYNTSTREKLNPATTNQISDCDVDLRDSCSLVMVWQNDIQCRPLKVTCKEMQYVCYPSLDESLHKYSLSQCLELFTEPERLNKNDAWYCPRCKEHREATKQLSLWRLPEMLIIQLKRFSVRNLIFRDKLDRFIDFPVRNLDVQPYLTETSPIQNSKYDLYGVVNHYGGMYGGHYTSFVKCQGANGAYNEWRLCDDESVTICEEEEVVTKHAYLLFYKKNSSKN